MHIFTLVYNNNTPPPPHLFTFLRQCENLKWTVKLKLGILLSTPPAHRMRISQFWESLPPHAFFGWFCHPHPSNTFKTMLRTFKTMQKKNWRERCLHQLRSSAVSCTGTVHSTKCEIVIMLNLTTRYTYNETNRKLTTWRSLLPPFLYVVHKVRLAMACRSTNYERSCFRPFQIAEAEGNPTENIEGYELFPARNIRVEGMDLEAQRLMNCAPYREERQRRMPPPRPPLPNFESRSSINWSWQG